MKTSKAGEELIKESEELRLEAYMPTPNDIPTIGFGTTLNVRMGDSIDLKTAEVFFRRDLEVFERCIATCIKVPLSQNQFDALMSLCYNIGCTNFKTSTLVKLLNSGDTECASRQFERWNKQAGKVLGGLVTRRQKEFELFTKG